MTKRRILSLFLVLLMMLGTVPTAMFGIFAADGAAPAAEEEKVEYSSLYVQDGLLYLWTAEGSTPGATVTSLPNKFDDGATAIDSLMRGDSYVVSSVFNDPNDAMTNMAISADGKSVVGDGFWKLDLTKFFPNAGDVNGRDGDVTLEVLQTNLAYGNRSEGGGWTNRKLYLLWAVMTYHTDVGNANGTNFSYISIANQNGESFGGVDASTLGPMLSEELNVAHTISMSTCRPALASGNENWSVWSFYRDGDYANGLTGGHNYGVGQDRNGDYAGARSLGYGIGYEKEAYSAIRLYNRVLSDAEMAQNHFVDICYALDIDLYEYTTAKPATKALIHQLTVGKTADEFTKADLTASINEIVDEYAVPEYNSFYVQNGLVFLWTAEGLTPGASVTSLPNLVDGGATALDTAVQIDNNGYAVKTLPEAGRVVSADGKSVIGNGLYKYDLTKFFPNAGKAGSAEENRDGDWTYEALMTNVSYGNRNFNNDGTYANMNNFLLWAKVVYGINTSLEGTNLGWYNSYTMDGNGAGWSTVLDGNAEMQTAMLTMLSEAEGVPYTLTLASDRPSFVATGNANWSVIYAYREATNGVSAGHNNGNTADANGGLDGYRSFIFGIGYEKEAYSSIRLYNRKLSDAEMAQNNFVDVAYMLGLNLKEYKKADATVKEAIHQLTVGKNASDFTKDALQASVDALLAPKEEITATAADYLTFAGYQVRATNYPGLRALFNVDTAAVAASEITVKEIGAIVAKADGRTAEDLTVSLQEDGTYKAPAGIGNAALYQNGVLNSEKLITRDESEGFVLTVIYNTVTSQTKEAYQTAFMYRGYVVVTDGQGEDHVLYLDIEGSTTLEEISAIIAEDPYYANCAPIKNVLDTCASEEIAFSRGWSNAEMGV